MPKTNSRKDAVPPTDGLPSDTSFREHLRHLLEELQKRTGAESCSLFLLRQDGSLTLDAAKGPTEPLVGQLRYQTGESITAQAFKTGPTRKGEPVSARHPPSKPMWRGKNRSLLDAKLSTPSAILAVPLLYESKCVGVLNLTWPNKAKDDAEVEVVEAEARELASKLAHLLAPLRVKESADEIYSTGVVRIELIKEVNARFLEYLNRHPDALHELDPLRFEELVAELLRREGWLVDLTLPTRDGGYDILAVRNAGSIKVQLLAQAKRYRSDRPVGVSAIRELYAVKLRSHASKAMLATTSYVSKPAKSEFHDVIPWELELKEYNDLVSWISRSCPE